MKKRIISAITAIILAAGLCGCSSAKEGGTHTHVPATYPPDETVVFDTESTENSVALMAEQLCGLGGDYTVTCDGEDYVQGGEAMLYTVTAGDTSYRMAVNYIGDRYVYSEEESDFITETLWLYEKSGTDRDKAAEAASRCWKELKPANTDSVAASGSLIYSIPGAEGPAFEVYVMNNEDYTKIFTFAVMPDMETVYMESDGGFVPFDASGANESDAG